MWPLFQITNFKLTRLQVRASTVFIPVIAFGLMLFLSGCASLHKKVETAKWGEAEPLPPKTENKIEALAHFATGVSNELNNDPSDATDEFLEAALRDLDQEDLVVDVARRLVREKRFPEAIDLLTRATSRPNPAGGYFTWLGIAYLQTGQTNLALQASQTAIVRAPQDLSAYLNLSQIYLQSQRTNDALHVVNQALEQTNAPAEFLLGLTDLLARFNRHQLISDNDLQKDSLKLLDLAATRTQDNPLFQQRIAELYMAQGEAAKAQPLYEALFERFPDVPGVREKLANIYLRSNQNEKAVKLLEELRRDNPTDPSTYFLLGSIAADAKKYDKATDFFETALKLNPEFEPAYYELAGVEIGLDKPAEALKVLDQARAKFKLNFVLEFYTAIANSALEKYSEALAHFTSAELIAKTTEPARLNYLFYFQVGATRERSGNIDEAAKAFRKCLELSPDYPEALNYLGYMWAERGENLDEAKKMIERALEKEPKNAAYLDSLAWVYFKSKKPVEALNYINQAITLSEKPDPSLFEHLGDIQLEMKQVDKAREAYSRALALKPDEKIKQKLETLGIR